MKQRLNYFISGLVLVIFSLYLVPHELVHVFYDHHDTEHSLSHSGTAEFSVVHIHCDFLNTDLTDFLPGDQPARSTCSTATSIRYYVLAVEPIKSILQLRESRGPPVL